MKTLSIYLTPIVLACFLIATTESARGVQYTVVNTHHNQKEHPKPKDFIATDAQSLTTTNVALSYSLDLFNWGCLYNQFGLPLGAISLTGATNDVTTGKPVLYVDAFVCTNAINMAFFKVSANVTTTEVISYATTDLNVVQTTVTTIPLAPPQFTTTRVNASPELTLTGPLIPTPQLVQACAGLIIAIMVVIVMGIIIYILIKTCNRLLPPPAPANP